MPAHVVPVSKGGLLIDQCTAGRLSTIHSCRACAGVLLTSAVDIYSFGIIMSELVSGVPQVG